MLTAERLDCLLHLGSSDVDTCLQHKVCNVEVMNSMQVVVHVFRPCSGYGAGELR